MNTESFDSRKIFNERTIWLYEDNEKFMLNCKLEYFQASGPGGQKRNRKYSAVRITHFPTALSAESCATRSQNSNKKDAIHKIKMQIATTFAGPQINFYNHNISESNNLYPLWLAMLFDLFFKYNFETKEAANELGISNSKLIKIIAKSSFAWKNLNYYRQNFGLSPLHL